MLVRLLSASCLALLAVQLAACGSSSYETVKIKEYRIAVTNNDEAFREEFRRLVDDFNSWAGQTVLTFEDRPADANSSITITEGLKSKTKDNVGLGQWLSETRTDSQFSSPGSSPKREIRYSMRLEFDADYIRANIGHKDRQKIVENQKLFFHEVGHGLEMNHLDDSSRNVMHKNVDGEKDFEPFFAKVRNYMAED